MVPYTDVFDTAEMADQIPYSLRTSRFDTNVSSNADWYMASRQLGVYGLLNEYAAYCWGVSNEMKMAAYYGSDPGSMTNTYVAHMEFRYYILMYMLYARDNYPAVYRGIMNNTSFLTSFADIDSTFSQLEELYRTQKMFLSMSSFDAEYRALQDAISEPEYQEMLRLLTGA